MGLNWTLRATAAPENFLTRGFSAFLSRFFGQKPRRATSSKSSIASTRERIALPRDLTVFLARLDGRALGDFLPVVPRFAARENAFASVVGTAKRSSRARAVLAAWLSGAVPFGTTRTHAPNKKSSVWLCFGAGEKNENSVIACLDEDVPSAPRIFCNGASAFAFACAFHAESLREETSPAYPERLPAPNAATQAAIAAAFETTRLLLDVLLGSDAAVRRAATVLARRDPWKADDHDLSLGALVEAFFRSNDDIDALFAHHSKSAHRVVRDAALVLAGASGASPRVAFAKDLAHRRAVFARAARSTPADGIQNIHRLGITRSIVAHLDANGSTADARMKLEQREEALHALAELGDHAMVPSLMARAVTGDQSAVEMLAALGDARVVPRLTNLLHREPQRDRSFEVTVVRALTRLNAKEAAPVLRALLSESPMPTWREGIERGILVSELVTALGTLGDKKAAPLLVALLEATSQEYRPIVPRAAWALGRLRHVEALSALERLLCSRKEPPAPEAIWAVGEIGATHRTVKPRCAALLEGLQGVDAGSEAVRLVALARIDAHGHAPGLPEIRQALDRALWEPAFRKDETSRRRTWALDSLKELAVRRSQDQTSAFFLGQQAVRYFVTRDDHRVRRAAFEAFAAWDVSIPKTRTYYSFVLDEIEQEGGLGALHDALRDPLGVFCHNVATRLAERGHPSSVRPLAEVTARLFSEPATSTYEYDDAPNNLVAFVRALARFNRPDGNDVLIDGLRNGHHQVRAVVAENAPDDPRFVPELTVMLGDPRSFLRSRAERSLRAMGVRTTRSSDVAPTEGA